MIRPFLLFAFASSAALAQPATIFQDTFTDAERLTQTLPASLAWHTTAAAAPTLGVRPGSLTLVANNNDRRIWAYFPAVELAIGDSLALEVAFTLTQTPPEVRGPGLKFALCHTNGVTPRRTDGATPAGDYRGYGRFTNPGVAASGVRIRKRSGPAAANTSATLLEVNDGPNDAVWETVGDARGGPAGVLAANTPYVATLRIARTATDTTRITTTITGGTLTAINTLTETDPANIVSAFDTLALEAAETAYGDLVISRVELVHESNTARLTNLSIRTDLASPGEDFTLGYVVGGAGTIGPKRLVIRAAGPALREFGLSDTLPDPKLELFAGASPNGSNDNWGGAATLGLTMASVGAFPFASPDSRDAAVLADITTPVNSVRVSDVASGTGAVIAELYDATPNAEFARTTPRLVNVSVRKYLGSGLTAGFVIGGHGPKTVLVRAIGPTLFTAFGVEGVVTDPRLELFSGTTLIAENDNWSGTTDLTNAFTRVGAFALPAASHDAALVAILQPGSYTAQVTGANNTTGTALVEVYEVP